MIRVGIIAGEVSGDQLGAALIHALRQQYPNIEFEGIAGPKMIAAGRRSLFPMEQLAVMGLVEVVKNLPQILHIRRAIIGHFTANPPTVFIGIDAPDFNLTVEARLKALKIPTVHYVSPTVWAWRPGRLKKIAKAVDLLLSILPFETAFYQKHSQIPIQFIGHHLADQIPLQPDKRAARLALGFSAEQQVVALMPGSRANEIQYLGELFIRTAQWCQQKQPKVTFIAPMVNAARKEQFTNLLQALAPTVKIEVIIGHNHRVLAAADVVLLASGTATLEAMLFKQPMVVAYRMSALTYFLAQRLIKTPFIALPNLLANKRLVPEFIQEQATVTHLGHALLSYLSNPLQVAQLQNEYRQLHLQLQRNASKEAAIAIKKLIPNAAA